MRKTLLLLVATVLISSLFTDCARRGTPIGGAKDTLPPILVKANPQPESINFEGNKIRIYFDEFIKLEDLKSNLVISPPQKNEPIITPLGTASKYISIKILDTLDPNMTYQYNFGNSIVDNNEGNLLGNFKYVFSTGDYIDSLEVKGEVTNPKVKAPISNIDVMLYAYDSTYTDSIIFKEKPRYIANTLDSTLYHLTNLRGGKYLLLALQDGNNNKIYNPESDLIGYIDDTIHIPTDSIFNFTLFKEVPEFSIIKPKEVTNSHAIFGFKGNPKGMELKVVSETPEDFKYHYNLDPVKDTIHFWHTPFESDSLYFEITNGAYIQNLTLNKRTKKTDSLLVSSSTTKVLNPLDTFHIKTNTPIERFDIEKLKIVSDSVEIAFEPILASSKNKLYLNFEQEFEKTYKIDIAPRCIKNIFGQFSDSLAYQITTKTPEDYGSIILNLTSDVEASFIVELLDGKEKLLRTKHISEPGKVTFKYLSPGDFLIRVTIDENHNGKWDTGSFLEKRQPERTVYFEEVITLRANWDLDQNFHVRSN